MASIADGQDFPQLQKAIDHLWMEFMKAYEITGILDDQFDHIDDCSREKRVEIMANVLKQQMEVALDTVTHLIDVSHRRLKQAA